MPIQGKDNFNYNFIHNKGLGKLYFDFSEKEIFKLLGKPSKIEVDIDIPRIEETKRFFYYNEGIMISISMYDGNPELIKIFPQKILLNGVNLFDLRKKKFLTFIKDFHISNKIEFFFEESNLYEEIQIFYFNIGLTVWFLDEKVSDICIEMPDL